MCRDYNYKPFVYKWCIDCGREKEINNFRNCKKCMKRVQNYIICDRCERCNSPKKRNILGLCPKCTKEVGELNNKFNRSL